MTYLQDKAAGPGEKMQTLRFNGCLEHSNLLVVQVSLSFSLGFRMRSTHIMEGNMYYSKSTYLNSNLIF